MFLIVMELYLYSTYHCVESSVSLVGFNDCNVHHHYKYSEFKVNTLMTYSYDGIPFEIYNSFKRWNQCSYIREEMLDIYLISFNRIIISKKY